MEEKNVFFGAAFNPSTINEERRTAEVVWYSGSPVTRYSFLDGSYELQLDMKPEAVDLSRLNNGKAPVLNGHNDQGFDSILGVIEKAWLEEGLGKAIIRFDDDEQGERVFNKVKNKIINNVSVGTEILERKITEREKAADLHLATKWRPFEISLVPIGADANAIIKNSYKKEEVMNKAVEKQDVTPSKEAVTPKENLQKADVDMDALQKEALKEAQEALQKRNAEITEMFAAFPSQEALKTELLQDVTLTAEQARTRLLEELGKNTKPINTNVNVAFGGKTEQEKFTKVLENSICKKAGLEIDPKADVQFAGLTLREMAREYLKVNNHKLSYDSRDDIGNAFTQRLAITHSTSDFPAILENIANKAMLKGYADAATDVSPLVNKTSASDFKIMSRTGLSQFSNLSKVGENSEFTYGTMDDRKELIQVLTYGRLFSISRQAIINDDMRAFTTVPQKLGAAARRQITYLVANVLANGKNINMSDGVALWHAGTHKNFKDSGAAPSATSIIEVLKAMDKQADSTTGERLHIKPKYLVVPRALQETAMQWLESQYDQTADNTNANVINTVRGKADLFVFPELASATGGDETAWYMIADPAIYDTIELSFLDGVETPFLEQQQGWSVDGVEFKVRIDAGCAPMDWKTMYRNDGA